jgi:3-hydroxyisobutyrate dehydrogenase-like beta-hydroxyacid dehydrogenase
VKIGFAGLGAMGMGIVPRLIAAGHTVTGWNRTQTKAGPLLKLGMAWANSPREVAAQSEIVFSIVTDAAAVQSVALGGDGIIAGLKKGGVYLDMSTIAPDASRAIAAEFARAGLTMLDAPISGSTVTLAEGKASIMVGGDKSAFERVQPVLLAIGPKVTHIGANGLEIGRAHV